jgi:hypothetical protein
MPRVLRPDVVARQVDVIPTERPQAAQPSMTAPLHRRSTTGRPRYGSQLNGEARHTLWPSIGSTGFGDRSQANARWHEIAHCRSM